MGRKVTESYRRIGDPEDRFDIDFWQAQGDEAFFRAALKRVLDAERLKTGQAVEPRLLRTLNLFKNYNER